MEKTSTEIIKAALKQELKIGEILLSQTSTHPTKMTQRT
jgi:hypothetical protein